MKTSRDRSGGAMVFALLLATGAAAADSPTPASVLSSYEGLAPAHTIQTRVLWRADPEAQARARTVRVAPVTIEPGAMFGIAREATDRGAGDQPGAPK